MCSVWMFSGFIAFSSVSKDGMLRLSSISGPTLGANYVTPSYPTVTSKRNGTIRSDKSNDRGDSVTPDP